MGKFSDGIKFGLGSIFIFSLFFGIYAAGWHLAGEVLPGQFADGDFSFNGSVGIGTNTPQVDLHVLGGNIPLRLERNGINAWDFPIDSYRLYFKNVNTSNMVLVLNMNGNVGIGTTSPAYKLDVVGGNTRIEGLIRNCPAGYATIGPFCIDLTCSGPADAATAEADCASRGGRICTSAEILSTRGHGCGYDSAYTWTGSGADVGFMRGSSGGYPQWDSVAGTSYAYYCCI